MNAVSASGQVARVLQEQILTGTLAPGTPLSQERLAKQFGVSRVPVRDALQRLSADGLVTPPTGGTVTVTSISIAELQELYELRIALEPLATRLATPNVGRADTLQMRRNLLAMDSTDDAGEWLAANAEFHAQILRHASRPRMVAMVEQLRKLTDRYLYLHLEVIGNTEHLRDEHVAILEAAEAGDANRTAELTKRHLETSHEFILNYLHDGAPSASA